MAQLVLDRAPMRTPSLFVAALFAFGLGCTSTNDGASPECSQYVDALKSYSDRCSSGGSTSARWPELEGRYKLACDTTMSLPGSGANPSWLDRCANALKTAACGGTIAECQTPSGTLADGSKCTTGGQCLSSYCIVTDASGCGVCGKTVPAGGACGGADRCVKGTRCTGGTCTTITLANAGMPCDYAKAVDCASGLYCDATSKTCKAPAGLGEPCATGYCQAGLSCDFAGTKTCYAPTVVGPGQACGGTSKAVCQSGLSCRTGTCAIITYVDPGGDCSAPATTCKHGSCLASTKTCPKLIPDGGACTGKPEDGVCDELANCFNGKCQLSAANKCG